MQNISRKERERLAREEEILDAAMKLFNEKGLAEASMDEIAREAQFTRKTVYQYFSNRDELLAAVILRAYRQLSACMQAASITAGSGFEKLRSLGLAFYRFYQDRPEAVGLISHTSHIKAKGSEQQNNDLAQLDKVLFHTVYQAIDEGKADGSVRRDIDTVSAASSMIFVVTGFFYELSISGKTFTEYLSLDIEHFVLSTLELIAEAFRCRS